MAQWRVKDWRAKNVQDFFDSLEISYTMQKTYNPQNASRDAPVFSDFEYDEAEFYGKLLKGIEEGRVRNVNAMAHLIENMAELQGGK